MKKVILIYILFSIHLQAQTDWIRWEKEYPNFQIKNDEVHKSKLLENNSFLSILKKSYSVLISDLDGDNCPFYPTCSSFFVQAVQETNILKGTLMFADRFTRDSNLFKSKFHYPYHISGKFYDPITNYFMLDSTITFNPTKIIMK